jgi:hypothetical protein
VTELLLCLFAVTAKGAADRPIILDGATDAYASEFVFFATDYGIYTFDRNSETWSRITTASGLPANRALALGLDEGVLWVATDSGLASADVRVSDWQTYDLPGTVRALAFDDRYVWAGGDSGLERFDKYSETWQHRSDSPVLDLLAEQERLWIASTSGVLRYDPKFDRIDQMPAPADSYTRIIETSSHIWFAGGSRLAGYRKDAASWSEHSPIRVADFSTLGDTVLCTVSGSPLIYDPGSDRWSAPQLIGLPGSVTDAFLTASEMTFASPEGLLVLDTRNNTRQVWTRSNGLEDDTLVRVYADQRFVYALTAGTIQYFNRQQELWKQENFTLPQARRKQLVWLDDAGAHLRIVPDTDIRLSGRAYYSQTRTLSGSTFAASDFENVGLNLAAQHKSGRTLSLFYDDSDKDLVAYGLGYRGIANDLLFRATGGKLRSEYLEFDLIPQFSTLGANARLVLPRPQTPDPGPLTLDLQAGRIESALRSEFFTGRSVDKDVTRPDVSYARGIFYRIPWPVASRWDTLYADDRNPATNTPRTRAGLTVGGVPGDFDPLVRGTDYFVDQAGGVIHLLGARNPGDALVLVTESGAQVIQSESVSGNALRNTYFLGPDITPGSFELAIADTAGIVHALSEFGIDNDRDGKVDPAFINHDLGFLSFPSPLVADSLSPSLYSLRASYRSQSTFYGLKHGPVVKNSETILVDGVTMTRGSDYVMDYTSAILLFLKKDAVTDFSQIDVRYSSVERPETWATRDMLFSGQPAIAIAQGVTLAPGFTRVADENIVHISGRAEAGAGTDRSLKFVPQFALSQTPLGNGSALGSGHSYLLAANYGIASASARYQGYSASFNSLGVGDRRYGPLRHSAVVSAGVEPLPLLRLDGSYQHDYREDTMMDGPRYYRPVQYLSGKLSYSNPKYPNGFVLLANDRVPDGNKLRAKVSAGYEFTLLKSRLKLNGAVQHCQTGAAAANTTLDHLTAGPLDHSLEYIAEATFALPFPVQGSVRYRNNGLSSAGEKMRREDELRGQLNVDVVPGLFYTGSYSLESEASPLGSSQDLALESFLYNNLQIAPGRWWSGLSVVNFSVGTGSSFDEYVRNLDSAYTRPFLLFQPIDNRDSSFAISSAHDLRTLYGTIQLQPFSRLTLRARRTVGSNGTAYYGLPELKPSSEDELRAEYEPGHLGMFTALFNSRAAAGLPKTTRRNVYFEWNMPWSELLRTRLTTTYGFDEEFYSAALTLRPQSISPGVEALFRFNSRSYATAGFGVACEQRTFSATGSDWVPDPWKITLRPAAGCNVNLLKFLYLQLSYQSALALSGTPTHTLSARLTTQF